MTIDEFNDKHIAAMKACIVEMGCAPNCDYPPLATGMNYFINEDENDTELNKWVFSLTGISGTGEGDKEGYIKLLEECVKDFNEGV